MKGKKAGPKSKAKAGPAEVARAAGCSKQLASRLLKRGMSEPEIVARIAENRARKAALSLPTVPVNGNGGLMTYAHAQTAKENWVAELRHLEVMRKRGDLVPVALIRQWGVTFLTAAKDELLKGPGELQDSLAAEADPLKVNRVLQAWVERCLDKFYRLRELWEPGPEAA